MKLRTTSQLIRNALLSTGRDCCCLMGRFQKEKRDIYYRSSAALHDVWRASSWHMCVSTR